MYRLPIPMYPYHNGIPQMRGVDVSSGQQPEDRSFLGLAPSSMPPQLLSSSAGGDFRGRSSYAAPPFYQDFLAHDAMRPLSLADETVMYASSSSDLNTMQQLAAFANGPNTSSLLLQAAPAYHHQQQQQRRVPYTSSSSMPPQSQHFNSSPPPLSHHQTQAMQQPQQQQGHQHAQPVHKPGMKDVPYWLKTLRLHKYTAMMAEMKYSEMMNLDEETLENKGVTKGARRKILQSIGKLKQRCANLRRLEATFESPETACLRCAIVELRQLVATPIMPYSPAADKPESQDAIDGTCDLGEIADENLPALMMRLLARVYTIGVSGDIPHDQIRPELLLMYFTICDRMLMNEAFTSSQKRRIVQWRRAARRFAAPADLRRIVLPMPPPPRCDACTPVSTFYFNDSLEDILRVQNLQRMVKQYLNAPSDMAVPSATSMNSPWYAAQAQAYAYRPSALQRKLYPRGGPVSAPPQPQYQSQCLTPSLSNYYGHHAPVQSLLGAASGPYAPHQRCCTAQQQAAAAHHSSYQAQYQQMAAQALAMQQAQHAHAAAARHAQMTAPQVPLVTPRPAAVETNQQSSWAPFQTYAPKDLIDLQATFDLGFSAERVAAPSVWDNTPIGGGSPVESEGSHNSSGYSSSNSERGSGAGSPGSGPPSALVSPPLASPPADTSAPRTAVSNEILQSLTVFDFCTESDYSKGENSMEAICRRLQNLSA